MYHCVIKLQVIFFLFDYLCFLKSLYWPKISKLSLKALMSFYIVKNHIWTDHITSRVQIP